MNNHQNTRSDKDGMPATDDASMSEVQAENELPAGNALAHTGTSSSAPPVLDIRPTTPPRGILQDWGGEPSSQADNEGKGKEIAHDSDEATGKCHLASLPPELIDSILTFLSPVDLAFVSAACRLLYSHGTADRLWQTIIQDHVPGVRVTLPYPFESFYQLYKAHDPHWFLTKHKIWFSDGDLTGRLVLTRYDQRRGCIEGYQLVAVSSTEDFEPWLEDTRVMIHAFEPEVKLHLDKPILHLPATGRSDDRRVRELATVVINLRGAAAGHDAVNQGEASGSSRRVPTTPRNRFQAETIMNTGSVDNAYCNFMFARPLDHAEIVRRSARPFPYGNIWPPPVIPARHRAMGFGFGSHTVDLTSLDSDKPTSRQELSDQIFRIRSGLHVRIPSYGVIGGTDLPPIGQPVTADALDSFTLDFNIGDAISTYSTLDPALYTPTPAKPFRGIWVGDYSGHGCEFLLLNQPDDTPENSFDPSSIQQREDESDEHFPRRKHDEMVYRGRLEGIKLTGDPNVPRGEYTFVADDIGEGGLVSVLQHEPFAGTRVVRSKGHIAHTGFTDDQYMDSQLLLISHDRLAQYWVGFRHISFYERVDIDRFLVPG